MRRAGRAMFATNERAHSEIGRRGEGRQDQRRRRIRKLQDRSCQCCPGCAIRERVVVGRYLDLGALTLDPGSSGAHAPDQPGEGGQDHELGWRLTCPWRTRRHHG